MKPKAGTRIDDIVEAAWELVREEGAARLSARALAARLGTSTMPIYSCLGNMDELSRLLRERVAAAVGEYQRRSWSPNPMLDAAVGYVRFARDEPRLFKFLWESSPGAEKLSLEALAERTRRAPVGRAPGPGSPEISRFLAALPKGEEGGLEFHVWIFVHGIASLAAEGIVDLDDKSLLAHLEAAGGAFYLYHSRGKEEGS
ncbi:MAG TPA: TetR-like C-terminal domain-containing protein [Rectinemataceae bacterium]|nr:TetR-like C-terminal domain-containing protein [Rectinemataceae bacterium]